MIASCPARLSPNSSPTLAAVAPTTATATSQRIQITISVAVRSETCSRRSRGYAGEARVRVATISTRPIAYASITASVVSLVLAGSPSPVASSR